ncbi:MAG TPA: FAD-dependent oxidoreductase [Solirubrobacteraceae bacterium]|nr:FAD-dependent oxidoreductase [Solirubrobacteraceae bacterium]
MSTSGTFAIVGGGLAGAKAARTLREEGFDGRIVLFAEEDVNPYERPPLSKDYLRGEAGRDAIWAEPDEFYGEQNVELRTGTAVSAIDTGASELEAGGERLRYDALLLATGAYPKRIPIPGADLDGVHLLRTVEDSDRLREAFEGAASRLVVIGAGWIGCEVAASARQKGLEVAMLAPEEVPLERVLGKEAGAVYRDIHAQHGVELLLGSGVEAIEGEGRVSAVRASGGRVLEADLVVMGVGVGPRTELAEAAGLRVQDGILVDAHLRTSVENVFAAGDVARIEHPLFGSQRVEHWHNALEQGPAAARSMLGRTEPYDKVPYFFSDQYDVGMEYAGNATDWDRVVFRGDPASFEFMAFWMRGDRVLAGMNVNVWDVTEDVQALVRSGVPVGDDALRDPDTPLTQLTAAAGG